ncbi:unnamed protein product [Dimorphilus gyrociliatus]|uniref:Uncharacterized protein n=1 Tax=Dimorphilus gyrociliatus TaxID=2664684 RepID=A0A7I8VLA6_9ANNE|nr:unnamed protein product [Dimorphilus gyrociliatus]
MSITETCQNSLAQTVVTEKEPSKKSSKLVELRSELNDVWKNNTTSIVRIILFFLLSGYSVYLGFAIKHSLSGAKPLIILTSIAAFFIIYNIIRDNFGDKIYEKVLRPPVKTISRNWKWLKFVIFPALAIGVVFFLSFSVLKEIRQLQSLSGIVAFILVIYIFSVHPDRICWRPVLWGFGLQFAMGVFVLRWKSGYDGVKWLSDQITKFIDYSNEGSTALFGDPFLILHPFVMVGLPMIIYLGAVMSILYFMGVTQIVAGKLGWLMQKTMGTTAVETLSVAANIFLNGMDTMLMLRPYLVKLTRSEFHCLMVGNLSTVAGFAFALFVLLGAPPQHLLSAAVMSAPAAIAIAKLSFPETEESITKTQQDVEVEKPAERNVAEAAANGAGVAGQTVAAVICNMLAFISMLGFVNASLGWIGDRVGVDGLSFQKICSYLLFPVSLLIGIDIDDAKEVASLLGYKLFTSEILAYQELGDLISANKISRRSAAISTYALCGFSGMSNLFIAVGVWNVVCPSRVTEVTKQMFRAFINANVACFMTACIAGLLYNPDFTDPQTPPSVLGQLVGDLLNMIPTYKDLTNLIS